MFKGYPFHFFTNYRLPSSYFAKMRQPYYKDTD
jgi:hypothetical protein